MTQTVDNTVDTVTGTVSKPLNKQPAKEVTRVVEEKPSEEPSKQQVQPTVIEKPKLKQSSEVEENSSEIAEIDSVVLDSSVSTELEFNQDSTQVISNNDIEPIEDQFTMERKNSVDENFQ
ncbi:hypothetical protein [Sporosarcina sp. A2]|uniref:hypothetical protein n=1 Tax=Sporosarcina sp. A2 TaxID=3393449 RepID=UPI003D7B15FA